MAARLFIGIFPTGIVYADRARERHGDYARVARLDFATLTLDVEKDCPAELREPIEVDAAATRARRGQSFAIDGCGHTVTLGFGLERKEG